VGELCLTDFTGNILVPLISRPRHPFFLALLNAAAQAEECSAVVFIFISTPGICKFASMFVGVNDRI
jgi:hypothetical protein